MGATVSTVPVNERKVRTQLAIEGEALRRLIKLRKWPWIPSFGLELEIAIVDAFGFVIHRCTAKFNGALSDPRVTCELGDWQRELNLTPVPARGRPFTAMYNEINALLARITRAAAKFGGTPVLIGIVPTLTRADTDIRYMSSDNPRYAIIDEGLKTHYPDRRIIIGDGDGALDMPVRTIADEAACTSQQYHTRTTPERFPDDLDAACIASGPAVAMSANSPFLHGHQLGHESRPAVFEGVTSRTPYGTSWAKSIEECFGQATAKPILLAEDYREDPLAVVSGGSVPILRATVLANGSHWPWHRAVWDPNNTNDPHFRIETRPDAAQPTPIDVVALAAFNLGLARTISDNIGVWRQAMHPTAPKENFEAAQKDGPNSLIQWPIKGRLEKINACELTGEILIPLAEAGLQAYGVEPTDIDQFLGVIAGRADTCETGSTFQLRTYREELGKCGDPTEALRKMFLEYISNAATGKPVHTWSKVEAFA